MESAIQNTILETYTKLIDVFSSFTEEEINSLISEHQQAPHLRTLQKALATDLTKLVHGEAALETALKTTDFLFGNGSLDFLTSLNSEEVLQVFEGIPQFTINRADYETGYDVLTLLADKTAIFPSKGEAKKMIAGGGVAINKEKITDATTVYQISQLINNQFLVAQKGKKNYFLINIQ